MTRSERARRGWEGRRHRLLNELFWERVDRSGGPDACWPWTGLRQTKNKQYGGGGYGYFTINRGQVVYAHRRALELTLGRSLELGEIAMHSCDNPPCANPRHLRAGTKAENSIDMARKGRSGGARLTVTQVIAIRAALATGRGATDVSREYGVAKSAIQAIKDGRNWRHVEAV